MRSQAWVVFPFIWLSVRWSWCGKFSHGLTNGQWINKAILGVGYIYLPSYLLSPRLRVIAAELALGSHWQEPSLLISVSSYASRILSYMYEICISPNLQSISIAFCKLYLPDFCCCAHPLVTAGWQLVRFPNQLAFGSWLGERTPKKQGFQLCESFSQPTKFLVAKAW